MWRNRLRERAEKACERQGVLGPNSANFSTKQLGNTALRELLRLAHGAFETHELATNEVAKFLDRFHPDVCGVLAKPSPTTSIDNSHMSVAVSAASLSLWESDHSGSSLSDGDVASVNCVATARAALENIDQVSEWIGREDTSRSGAYGGDIPLVRCVFRFCCHHPSLCVPARYRPSTFMLDWSTHDCALVRRSPLAGLAGIDLGSRGGACARAVGGAAGMRILQHRSAGVGAVPIGHVAATKLFVCQLLFQRARSVGQLRR